MASDLERLHDRIDEIQKDVTSVRVDIADIKARLPVQPCPQMKDHLEAHKEANAKWHAWALKFASPAAIIAALVALWKSYSENS